MTTPADNTEGRSASSGGTRTPPPRTRRGTPTTRTTVDELDSLLDAPATAEPVEPTSPGRTSTPRGFGSRGKPKPDSDGLDSAAVLTPGPNRAFDWETQEERDEREAREGLDTRDPSRARTTTTTNRDATVAAAAAAAEVYGDPVEPEIMFDPAPSERLRKPKPVKRPQRRYRQTVQKVDLWSVTKMALCFYVSAMGVVVVSLVALWVVADSAGIIDNVENFIGDLFSSDDFQFVSGQVLRGAVLIAVVLVALMVAFTIIAASFYNIFAELFGGVEIVIREEEQPPKR